MSIRTCLFVSDRAVRKKLLDYSYQTSCPNFEVGGVIESDIDILLDSLKKIQPKFPADTITPMSFAKEPESSSDYVWEFPVVLAKAFAELSDAAMKKAARAWHAPKVEQHVDDHKKGRFEGVPHCGLRCGYKAIHVAPLAWHVDFLKQLQRLAKAALKKNQALYMNYA